MQKISIKREQSQAGLSFAEREKFRPQVKNKLLLLLALLMTAATGAWAQGYNVTFGGLSESEMNTTVNVASLPQTFTAIGNVPFYPWTVISTSGNIYTGASVTSGGEGKVSVSVPNYDEMSITVTGPFEGTATIHVTGEDDENRSISCDITVACVAVGGGSGETSTYSVTMKDGTEDADNWTGKAGDATEYQKLPLEGVAEGAALTLKYSGTKKVLGVKAEKKAAGLSISLNNPAVGQLIGNDGKNYNYGAVPTGVTALAMICHISGDHGVALALEDYGFNTWNAVKEALENYEPKFTNATWDMPTEDEWEQMNQTAGGYGALRDSFANVGGTNMSKSSYWSSTSVDANNAKNFSFFNGSWSSYGKNNNRYTRLRLAW